jgi:hypothetical protein
MLVLLHDDLGQLIVVETHLAGRRQNFGEALGDPVAAAAGDRSRAVACGRRLNNSVDNDQGSLLRGFRRLRQRKLRKPENPTRRCDGPAPKMMQGPRSGIRSRLRLTARSDD